jgi:hypothetical protein
VPIAAASAVAVACIAVVLVVATRPRIGREAVTQVTVTVTSPAFAEVTVQQRALERALADGDVADVATSAERLRIALLTVAPSELLPVRAEIESLLERADALLDRRRRGNEDLPSSQALTSALTSAPPPTGAAAVAPPPTGTAAQANSPAAPPPPAATTLGPAAPAPATTLHDRGDDDGHSGPGGGDSGDSGGGSGSGNSGDSGGGSGSGSSGDSGGGSGSGDSGGSGSGGPD